MKYIAKRPDFIGNDHPDIMHDGMRPGNREIPVHSQRQQQKTALLGDEYPNEGITVSQPLTELLLQQAAQREIPAEEIVMQAIKKYLERSGDSGR